MSWTIRRATYTSTDQPDVPDSEKWRPQIRYGENKLGLASLHVPVWKLAKRLPVDLCFSVEFRIENTDTVIRCNDLVSLANREARGYFSNLDFDALPSCSSTPTRMASSADDWCSRRRRSAALTNEKVNRYYGGEITTRPLRFQVLSVNRPVIRQRLLNIRGTHSRMSCGIVSREEPATEYFAAPLPRRTMTVGN